MNAGLVGLSITYTMTLMGMFQWGVRQSAEVENQVSLVLFLKVLMSLCIDQSSSIYVHQS